MVQVREVWLDNLRGIACLMVVMVHVTGIYLYQWGKIGTFDWYLANFLDSASRACVPIFFMLSGYLFFQDKTPKAKNFIKISSALLFYSVVYLLATWLVKGSFSTEKLLNILTTPVHYHLWFFYAIFIIYALAVLVKVRINNQSLRVVLLLLAILVVFNIQWQNLMAWTGFSLTSSKLLGGASIIYYFIYAVLAVYLAKLPVYGRYQQLILLLVYIVSTLVIALGTGYLANQHQKYIGVFYDYNSVPVFISAFALFLFFRHLDVHSVIVQKILTFLSKYSLGIYGSHVLFLEILQYVLFPYINNVFVRIVVVFGLTLLMSCLFAVLIRRVDKKAYLG